MTGTRHRLYGAWDSMLDVKSFMQRGGRFFRWSNSSVLHSSTKWNHDGLRFKFLINNNSDASRNFHLLRVSDLTVPTVQQSMID